MDQFPCMLFRWPAQLRDAAHLQDGKYDTRTVDGQDGLSAALAEGWFETAATARAAGEGSAKAVGEAASQADNAPATRAELEAKATELALKFDGRTSDRKLRDLIAATLKE